MQWYRNMTDSQALKGVCVLLLAVMLLVAFICVETGFTTNRDWFVEASSVDIDSISWVLVSDKARVDSGVWVAASLPKDTIFSLDDTKTHQILRQLWFTGETKPITDPVEIPTLAVPGDATISSDDKEDIAQLVLDTATEHPEVFGSSTGIGAYACTVFTMVEGAQLITGVTLLVQDSSGTSLFGAQRTDAAGFFVYSLDAGQYRFLAMKGGYTWSPDLDTITGNESVVITGSSWTVDPPTGDSLCRLYGYCDYITGVASSRPTITVTPIGRFNDTCTNTIIDPRPMRTSPDSDGYWFMDLKKSKCLAATDGSASDSAKYSVKVGDRDPVDVYIYGSTTQRLEW